MKVVIKQTRVGKNISDHIIYPDDFKYVSNGKDVYAIYNYFEVVGFVYIYNKGEKNEYKHVNIRDNFEVIIC